MKKKFILIFTVVLCIMAFAACGEKRECDFCGEEKNCTVKEVMGEEVAICNDCVDSI